MSCAFALCRDVVMKSVQLESMRGIAALAVAFYHSCFIAAPRSDIVMNSVFFVDFFFVLSGFVMALAYHARIWQGMGLTEFLVLRLGRLFPLHAFAMLLWVVWLALYPPELRGLNQTWQNFLANLLLVNAEGLTPSLAWNYPSWSIGAEMVAYLSFWGVAVALGRRLNLWVALAISGLAYAVLFWAGDTVHRTFDYGAVRCVGGFYLGVAVFCLHKKAAERLRPGTAVECAVLAAGLALLSHAPGDMAVELLTIVWFGVAVFVFARSGGAVSHLLAWQPLVFLGQISYSVYLLHALAYEVAFHLSQAPLLLVDSAIDTARNYRLTPFAPLINLAILGGVILCSWCSWQRIEEPGRRWSKAFAARLRARATARALPRGI